MIEFKLFINPGLVKDEKKLLSPMLVMSINLIFISILFAYLVLIPAAIKFFIVYSQNMIAPLWSFVDYFDFILSIFLITAIVFQIPTLQLILGIFDIISGSNMLSLGKYVTLATFIISAILTPSTDPFTQFLLSFAILTLYFLGSSFLILAKG
jgi:sec-independent protein translocase protein TatC